MKNPMDEFPPCALCGKDPNECQCPICGVCGTIGDPMCLTEHVGAGIAKDDLLLKIEREFRRMTTKRLSFSGSTFSEEVIIADNGKYEYSLRDCNGNSDMLWKDEYGWNMSINGVEIKPTEMYFTDKLRNIYANVAWLISHKN